MNLTLFIPYSYLLNHKPKTINRVKKLAVFFFSHNYIKLLIRTNNEHSVLSFLILNYKVSSEFYNKNSLKNFYRFLFKKEISFIKKEIIYTSISAEFYKNFNHWNNLNWFNKKEFSNTNFFFPALIFKIKTSETKNFHEWGEILDFLFFLSSNVAEKILLLDVICSLENFNYGAWNFNYFFIIKMKIIKTNFFFFCQKFPTKWGGFF